MKRFPTGKYGRQSLRFFPAPFRAPLRAFAGLLFAWSEDRVLICDICDRGWCIPSGRVEPDEDSREAVIREALEEGGAIVSQVQYIGCYQICERQEVRWADCYAGTIDDLVEITVPAESRGRQLVLAHELPAVYHQWNELTSKVFDYSREVVDRSNGST
ncbi:MAG: NUDIX domain-containing protein [Armatimonadetes bacterium]|nr:NUDIX domain-containing protein [Armatimonadota bacterium]